MVGGFEKSTFKKRSVLRMARRKVKVYRPKTDVRNEIAEFVANSNVLAFKPRDEGDKNLKKKSYTPHPSQVRFDAMLHFYIPGTSRHSIISSLSSNFAQWGGLTHKQKELFVALYRDFNDAKTNSGPYQQLIQLRRCFSQTPGHKLFAFIDSLLQQFKREKSLSPKQKAAIEKIYGMRFSKKDTK